MKYDLIVIGAGPAGITAGVYAARKRMQLAVFTQDIGGQAAWSGDIGNYTGYQFISGPDLAAKFAEHMRAYAIPVRESETVTDVHKEGDSVVVVTDKGSYEAHAVIIASGKRTRQLHVPGENEFKNKGLTYCATCDGPLFAHKTVSVIGGGNSALDAVLQLMKIAQKVYLITNAAALTGDPVMQEKARKNPAVEILTATSVKKITGDSFVRGITVQTADGADTALDVEGVFVEIGLIPNAEFAKTVKKNDRAEIVVNARNETTIPGLFAAGDVTDVPEKQIIIAAGEGAKAALSAFHYLSRSTHVL